MNSRLSRKKISRKMMTTTIMMTMLCALMVIRKSFGFGGDTSSSSHPHDHPHQQPQQQQQLCRDRFGSVVWSSYQRRTCISCHVYLFRKDSKLPQFVTEQIAPSSSSRGSSTASSTRSQQHRSARDFNETVFNDTCRSMSTVDCQRWRSCCEAAEECCREQILRVRDRNLTTTSADDNFRCAATWDGFRCWDSAEPGSYETQSCPDYMEHALPTRRAVKHCTKNGTWYEKKGHEWTDYTQCVDKASYLYGVYTCLGFNALNVSMLLPSIAIFLIFRDLSRQPRIRLHINFFLSLTMCSLLTIFWYLFVHYELLTNSVYTDTVIYRNPVWCRIISFLKTYFTSTTYFWMFCEGCYLYRLLSKAFQQPESLRSLYLLGWVTPAVSAVLYGCARAVINNDGCWAKNVGGYEWIVYTPNLLCLILNCIFLCNILRILLFQLHAHPQEPNSFRRGLKAGLMLIPLFGLHLLLTIYRPDPLTTENKNYEYITLAITNSQGVFVSLIFCFMNGEVMSHICRSPFCGCLPLKGRLSHHQYATHVTQVSMTDDRSAATTSNSMKLKTSSCSSNRSSRGFGGGGTPAAVGNSFSEEGVCLQDMSTNVSAINRKTGETPVEG